MHKMSRFFVSKNFINGLFIVLFIFLCTILILEINKNVTLYESDKYKDISNLFTTIEHSLDDKIHTITYLHTAAENWLENPPANCHRLTSTVDSVPEKDYFAIDERYPKSFDALYRSNLTGYADLKKIDADEICMALSLNPLFYDISTGIKDIAWVYYTSKKGFINLFPYVDSDNFHLQKKDMDKECYTYGLPQYNPDKSYYMTPLYEDAGGLGLMISIGMPVYHDSLFRGVVAFDMTIEHLTNLLSPIKDFRGSALIKNRQGQVLAAYNIDGFKYDKITPLESLVDINILDKSKVKNGFSEYDGKLIYHQKFHNAPWEFVYFTDKADMYQTVFKNLIPLLLIFFFLAVVRILVNKLFVAQSALTKLNAKLKEKVKAKSKEVVYQRYNYEMLFEQSSVGICLLKEARILECNKTLARMFGYQSKESLLGHFILAFSPKIQPSGISSLKEARQIQRDFIEQKSHAFEWQFKRKNGELFWADISSNIINIKGEKIIQVICKDISMRKTLEKENKIQTNQLIKQSKLAQMGEMLSMISHQWRQPLGSISMVMMGLQMKIEMGKLPRGSEEEAAKSDAVILEYVEKVNKYVQFLSSTIDDFKNFFQPQKEYRVFDINSLINEAITLIAPTLQSKSIMIEKNYRAQEAVESYENEIKQVILNILNNAKDAMVENQSENATIMISTYTLKHTCMIEITDTGGGIRSEDMPKIFDPYFSTKSKNGTGLGLYMSKMIIEEHCKGKLDVKNKDKGASFTISLPLMPAVMPDARNASIALKV